MDPCCDRIIGGEVYISVGDVTFQAMGDVTISPTTSVREAMATAGGMTVITSRSKSATFSMDLANLCGDSDPMMLWESRCNVDVTVVEKSRGIRHLFTKSSIVGEPSINLSTGVLSGLQGATDNYSRY